MAGLCRGGTGLSEGGMVSGSGHEGKPTVMVNIDLRGTVFYSRQDVREPVNGIDGLMRRRVIGEEMSLKILHSKLISA